MQLIRIIIGMALVTMLAFADNGVNAGKEGYVKQPVAVSDSCLYYEVQIKEQLRITDSLLTIKYIKK